MCSPAPREPYSYRGDASVPQFPDDRPIIVFDGYCALCTGWAKFVLRHDRQEKFRLLPAQHELVPKATTMALLVNPANPALAETATKGVQAAARNLGLELYVLNASTERDFDGVFAKLVELRAGGLVIGSDPFFTSRSEHLAALTVRHAVPTVYAWREFAVAGGLLSYGADISESYRLTGNYTGRVLKGDKPADLPVQQVTKVELIINLKTAKALGLIIPNTLVGRADEVIE
jgi:putative tryptophan/tyrosine transport system substrate-binding protein